MAAVSCDDTHRLMPGTYTEQAEHALSSLCDDDDGLTALVQLAAFTNSRIQAQEERHPAGLGRSDMSFGLPFSKIVNAAFAFHRIRHLEETGLREEPNIPYRLFLADIHGQDFAHLGDDSPATRACLDPHSYVHGQELGKRLLAVAVGGIVYPSVRRPSGQCIAVLVAPLVANVRSEALYHLTISDGRLAEAVQVQ